MHVHVDAPPEIVYGVVSDVTRMGEWSPETVKCEWLDGAIGPRRWRSFQGHEQAWHPDMVDEADGGRGRPGREFAFEVGTDVRWTYRFAAEGTGTRLTESFEMLATCAGTTHSSSAG